MSHGYHKNCFDMAEGKLRKEINTLYSIVCAFVTFPYGVLCLIVSIHLPSFILYSPKNCIYVIILILF